MARVWASTVAALWLIATPALADEAAEAFHRGMRHLEAGRYDAACRALAKAEVQGGATLRTRYQLGRCNQERGRWVAAHQAYADAERLAIAAGDDKSAAAARTRMRQVAARIGPATEPPPRRAPAQAGRGQAEPQGGKASSALFWTGLGFVIAGPLITAGAAYTYVEEEDTEIGITGMVVGGALLAVGIPFMIYGGADAGPERAAIRLGPGWLGVSGTF